MALVIPNVTAGLGGQQNAVLMDQNWNAIRDYVNARNPTSGVIGSRPAFGTAGFIYVATDVGGGTPYLDTGSAWVAMAAGLWSKAGTVLSYVAGDVGIGTTSPTTLLHLSGVDNGLTPVGGTYVRFTNTTATTGTSWHVGTSNNGAFRISQSGIVECLTAEPGTGNVLLGPSTTMPEARLHLRGVNTAFGAQIKMENTTASTGKTWALSSLDDGSWQLSHFGVVVALRVMPTTGRVGIGGVATPSFLLELNADSAAKPTSNTWTISSDSRLKKDIAAFTDGLAVIKQIDPISYKLNGKGGLPTDAPGIGVIGQDIESVAPYTISRYHAKLEPDDEEDTELIAFNSSALTFVLINAVKELAQRIEALEG